MITIRLFCCFVVVQFLFRNNSNSTTIIEKSRIKELILSSIGKLCPNARICKKDDNLQNDVLNKWPNGTVPCCGACSCEDDCDENDNCCFLKSKENSTSETAESAELKSYHSSCLFPGTRFKRLSRNYNMIDTCPFVETEQGQNTSKQERNPERCGDVRVAWNEMLPVYSPTTKKLYKNTACSSCHGVKDGIVWDIIRSCTFENRSRHTKVDMSEFLNIGPGQSQTSNCILTFSFPGHWIEIEHARCILEPIVNTCGQLHFEIPAYINMTTAEVVDACESSLYSPIIPPLSQQIFANVYCSICNLQFRDFRPMCKNPNVNLRHDSQFSYLLKGFDFQEKYINKQKPEIEIVSRACLDDPGDTLNGKDCRPVHCRTGQIRNRAGECHYIVTYWSTTYDLVVDLIPDKDIPTEYLEDVRNDLTLTWLRTPFRNNWNFIMLLYQSNFVRGNAMLKKLIASLRIRTSVPVQNVLNNVKYLLKKQWHLHLNGTTFNLRQELSPSYDFRTNKKHPNCASTSYWNNILTQNGTMCRFTKIFISTGQIHQNSFVMTKLIFCEQVDLRTSEYDNTVPKKVIFYRRKRRTLFEGEFASVYNPDTGNYSVRLCLDDAGFKMLDASSSARCLISETLISVLILYTVFPITFYL